MEASVSHFHFNNMRDEQHCVEHQSLHTKKFFFCIDTVSETSYNADTDIVSEMLKGGIVNAERF